MMPVTLLTDSGATKAEWCLLKEGKKKTYVTQGMNPYFFTTEQMANLITDELKRKLKKVEVENIFFYGAGCANPENRKNIQAALTQVFPEAKIEIDHDLTAAARALCGHERGMACILGTGSNSCYYNGKKIVKNSPGLGYVLGDEGSGAYLGKKVVQYYLYHTFDEDLRARFDAQFTTTPMEILEQVYKKPMPNRYLASFALFLSQNRGHYMVENILEDGLNDFFFTHLCKYKEVWTSPVNFVGSIAYVFKDVLLELCNSYEFEIGKVLKNPLQGLINYHSEQ